MFLLISLDALVYTVTVKMACILFAICGCFSYSCLSCAVTEDKHLCTLLWTVSLESQLWEVCVFHPTYDILGVGRDIHSRRSSRSSISQL